MKTIIIGFDAFDPLIFEKLHSEGKTPNLSQFVAIGGYSPFSITDPPQSEVSWTSIATGMNPGEHGIFDFVHRNPISYERLVSLLPTKTNILGKQFVPPHSAPTIFDAVVKDGYPGISLWWPATFPARLDSPVWSIPGLGTPDIFGRLGVGISYSLDGAPKDNLKTRVEQLIKVRNGIFKGNLEGPVQMALTGLKETHSTFELFIREEGTAQLLIDNKKIDLVAGQWSPFIELSFKIGLGLSIKAVTQAIITRLTPEPHLYFLPLQIHPLRSPWPYGTPKRFLKDVWKNNGPYLTLGWPQDTTGLEEDFINDDQFLTLCQQILSYRERTLMRVLDSYKEGVVACVFDSLDRIQHMFLRDRKDVIESWYVELDALLGRVLKKLVTKQKFSDVQLIVVSDHGFGEFKYKVDLNRFLLNHGFLSSKTAEENGSLNQVDWAKSKVYAIGLNSIYINMLGREGQGVVSKEDLAYQISTLKTSLLDWKGPDGGNVVRKVLTRDEAFKGPYSEYGPDLLVGYNPGYRASAKTGLGDWAAEEISQNLDHWGSDHCFSSDSVPGVIFSNQGLSNFPNASYRDFPVLAIQKELHPVKDITLPIYSDEDQEKVEERLKELGYL